MDVNVTTKNGADYSSTTLDVESNLSADGRALEMPRNAIYEIKYPNMDIKGTVR